MATIQIHHKQLKILTVCLTLLAIAYLIYYYWQKKLPLVSPITLIENSYITQTKDKVVYGFIPYWNLKYVNNLQISHLTHLAYFALDLNPDGTAHKKTNPKELEPGWNKLNSQETKNLLYQSKLLKQKTVLTVTAMETKLIESILDNQTHSQNAINSILEVYRNFNFDGINIDFEYVGTPQDTTINNFTEFIKTLRRQCLGMSSKCFIDIDVFGDSSEKKRLWDLEKIHPHVD